MKIVCIELPLLIIDQADASLYARFLPQVRLIVIISIGIINITNQYTSLTQMMLGRPLISSLFFSPPLLPPSFFSKKR
jgi:hypothetical protein